jgi:hypothetical protein
VTTNSFLRPGRKRPNGWVSHLSTQSYIVWTHSDEIVPMIELCQIKIDGYWKTADFAEASKHPTSVHKRCPECHGRVTPYNSGGAIPHFGHYVAHKGCPLSHNFEGSATILHPHPLK